MRPVRKWVHSDLSLVPPIKETYNPYQDAKVDLERNIGGYCSYCERRAEDEAVHVEHIQPKHNSKYAHLAYAWSNFLLACARCNGTDNKGKADVVLGTVHLPHLNNTAISISYGEGGFVQANNTLVNHELTHAKALINLVGLDKRPGVNGYLQKDKRWDRRREVWEIAKRCLLKYEQNLTDASTVLDLAKGYGFWSVWFNVFQNHIVIKQALVEEFNGTDPNCFDANFNTIRRNPGHPTDTV